MAAELIETTEPVVTDPQLVSLVAKVTAAIKLELMSALSRQEPSAQLAAVNLGPDTPSARIHAAAGKYFSRLAPEHRRILATRLVGQSQTRAVLAESKLVSPVSIKLASPVLQQLNLATEYAFLGDLRKAEALVRSKAMAPWDLHLGGAALLGGIPDAQIPEKAATPASQAHHTGTLKFRVHEVRCLDPSDWEWGSDEISMGGVTTDDDGKVQKVKEAKVKSGFDANESKRYDPPNVLKTFAVDGAKYPKPFAVCLSLAEKDSGGFADFLQELYAAIKEHINAIVVVLGTAAGIAVAGAVGGAIGAVGGPLGALLGVAAGMVIAALVSWIADALRDDMFRPKMAVVAVPEPGALFNGSSTSAVKRLDYYDHGAHYVVRYSWQIEW